MRHAARQRESVSAMSVTPTAKWIRYHHVYTTVELTASDVKSHEIMLA